MRFERHLAGCEVCRQEARSLREAAGRLAAVTAVSPPQHVREQVLTEAARTRQRPPLTVNGPADSGAGRRALRVRAPRMAVAIVGGRLLGALVLRAPFLHPQQRVGQDRPHTRATATGLPAPDAVMTSARAVTGGTATVVMSHRDHALVLTTARLPAPPSGKRYEVWLMGQHRIRAAGMLPQPRDGMTAPVVVSGVAAGDMLALTTEQARGSRSPSSVPMLMIALPS